MAQPTITTGDYTLEKAIAFYRNHVKEKRINPNSGNAKCAALNTLIKKAILTSAELGDIRTIDLVTLSKRMAPYLEHMTASSQRTYTARANLAIREYIRWKIIGKFTFMQAEVKPTKSGKLNGLLGALKDKTLIKKKQP